MLSVSVVKVRRSSLRTSRARRRQERGWLQWPGASRPFASPAPDSAIGAPRPPIAPIRCRSAAAASRLYRHLPHQRPCSASILPPYAAKLRVGPAPKVGSPDKLASPPLAPFLQGKAGQARPWLSPARYSSATLPGQARQRCFGRPECGPDGPLAQRVLTINNNSTDIP